MGLMGRLKVVVVKVATTLKNLVSADDDPRFRKPGRISHQIEDGRDYRSIEFDPNESVEDLLPNTDKPLLPTELKYVLILNFQAPITKT